MSGPVGKFAIVRLPGKLPALDTFGSCLDWKRGLIPVQHVCRNRRRACNTKVHSNDLRQRIFDNRHVYFRKPVKRNH